MKIAITGGAGFIGTELARLLKAQGHELVLIDLKKSTAFPESSHIADVTHKAALTNALAGVDAIYHLAAEHRDDVRPIEKYYDVNVGGAENIVAVAQEHGIQTIIFTSSVALYGLDAGDSNETDTPNPFNDYGRSKLESEKVFEKWARQDPARKLINTRLVATFGPGNRGNVYTLIDQIARGKFVMIGSGRNHKSIAYVGNVAAFLKESLSFAPGFHLYNYADKPDLDATTLVTTIRAAMGFKGIGPQMPYAVGLAGGLTFDVAARLTGKSFPISAIRVKKFCANTVVNADKLKTTGFIAPYTLEHGLRDMIAQDFAPARKAA